MHAVRVAVLGAGRIGRIHAANAAAHPAAVLVAVADPVEAAATSLADALRCEAVGDPLAPLARTDIDAVVIATPTDTHVELLLHAARAGKAVLCEKPIDLDIARADAAIAELGRHAARVMLAFNRRFDPSAHELSRAVRAGAIGDVRQVIITSRDPGLAPRDYLRHSGGIFRDMIIHDFDMARWLLDEEPATVTATASRLVDPTLAEIGDYDTVMVQLTTASGRQCHINGCRQASYGYDQRLEVFGSRGMLLNDNLRPTTVRRYTESATEARDPLQPFFLERYADAYRLEMDAFVTAVRDGRPMPVTPGDARRALHLADCALVSATTGAPVTV